MILTDDAAVTDNELWDCDPNRNQYSGRGGGIYVEDGSVSLSDSARVVGNAAGGSGGVGIGEGSLALKDAASITGNQGGGVRVYGDGSFTIVSEATVSGNTPDDIYP